MSMEWEIPRMCTERFTNVHTAFSAKTRLITANALFAIAIGGGRRCSGRASGVLGAVNSGCLVQYPFYRLSRSRSQQANRPSRGTDSRGTVQTERRSLMRDCKER